MPSSRILLVDDQREVSRLLHSALDTLEYDLDIVEVPSGEEAILDSSLNPIDLLVSDYRLPGISGIELMRKVRRYRPNVKVILITGQADPNIRKEVSEAGADDFFIKPIPIADFLDSVEHHLGLVGTNLPPEAVIPDKETETQFTLPDLMVGLRQELDAVVVLLLDDKGSIQAHAEDLPDGNEKISMLSSLLSIYNAGQNVSRLLGQKVAANWYIFNGAPFDLVFAPVGMEHSILVIGKGLADEEQVLKTFDKFSIARKQIEMIMSESSSDLAAAPMPPASPPEVDDPDMPEMGPLLRESKAKLNPADVDDFWDKAADTHKAPTEPDKLSYDQAKELGLGPEDES
jgi:DNA-binding response OmpR family regulator